nr:winged helix-turn-helix domain-containing protein [Natronobiforma cellulositropha]
MNEEPTLETVLSVLEDEYARAILEATRTDPLSANELSDRSDASLSTVCRRLERLEAVSLVRERTRPRADGHHDTVYVATLEEFRLRLEPDGFTFDLRRDEEDVADRLRRLWGDL